MLHKLPTSPRRPLNDGTIMRFPTTLEEKNIANKSNFFDWNRKSDSYKRLIGLLKEKIFKDETSLHRYIYSSNQINAYRMIVMVGLGFNLLALLVIIGFGAKFNPLMLFPICFGLVLIMAGIFGAVIRRRNESFIMKELNKAEK